MLHVQPCRTLFAIRGICLPAMLFLAFARAVLGQGQLDAIRQNVRVADQPAESSPAPPPEQNYTPEDHGIKDPDGTLFIGTLYLGAMAVTSPFWAPHSLLGDDFSVSHSFARYPYDNISGYTTIYGGPNTKLWSAQFSTDYATTFNNLDCIGGHLAINTSTRFGVDASAVNFRESLANHRRDDLWLGDGNITFCFAQDERMQWRTGLGMNWLTDSRQTDVGFNFTYGFDWFPRKPWVVSASIDLGNLGHSGFFHFRGTVGAVFNRFEAYTGYEYYDFDSVQLNALIGGLRVWF